MKHPDLDRDQQLEIVINGSAIVLDKYSNGMDFHISKDSLWVRGKPTENGLIKKQGTEGPFLDGETEKFLLIYGTGKADKIDLLKKIGTLLQNNYSKSDIEVKLVPDTLVEKNKLAETNNLYLIGSPEENIYLKEILPDLPLTFSKDSLKLKGTYSRMETGIQMIYPNPKQVDRYVIIDKYPENLVIFDVADYFIYSLKDGELDVHEDGYFDSNWQVGK